MPGYSQPLYILPFDHRGSFIKSFIGPIKLPSIKQAKLITDYKKIIFAGFLLALKYIQHPEYAAIMLDEDYGLPIIQAAKKKNVLVCLSVEKSRQKSFAFQYGVKFGQHILDVQPAIVKALIRYNPLNKKINQAQLAKLKELNDWCQANKYKFMVEPLVPATPANLKRARGKQEIYDAKIRPGLTLRMIREFYAAGIQPDIWKIEAFENKEDWQAAIDAIRDTSAKKDVAIIMLGRGESFAKVKSWMNIAPKHLLNGFAVGRTVFLRPLMDFHTKKINKDRAIKEIAKNYIELVKYWQKE